ncbi:MAG TPA: S9 family peptidase [Ignavibacteria bacterium]|nr:S9 family peptidase [Ignavibacteria bacterium]
MKSNFIERKKILLNDSQSKMLISGWSEKILQNTIVENISYNSDGLKVKGYLAYPKDTSKKYPCLIWNRGGYGDNGAIDIFNARGMFGNIANEGYVVFASHYRGNFGSEGLDELGGEDVNDVLNLVPLADELEFADKNIWGMEGWSRGGMMTYLSLSKSKVNFKAVMIVGGVSNLHCSEKDSPYIKLVSEKIFPGLPVEKFSGECEKRSVTSFINKLPKDTHYLLLHGTADESVAPMDTINLAGEFQKENLHYRLVMFEEGDHFLRKHRKEVSELRKMWFKKYL